MAQSELDHWTYPTGCGCHPECPACAEESENECDLSGLSENDRALHSSIASVLSCEIEILDPDDADALALVVVNELPPVYNAAPDLLAASIAYFAAKDNDEKHHAMVRMEEAIEKAKGE